MPFTHSFVDWAWALLSTFLGCQESQMEVRLTMHLCGAVKFLSWMRRCTWAWASILAAVSQMQLGLNIHLGGVVKLFFFKVQMLVGLSIQ